MDIPEKDEDSVQKRHWRRSDVFYCLLWAYFTPYSSISIVGFEQVNASRVVFFNILENLKKKSKSKDNVLDELRVSFKQIQC